MALAFQVYMDKASRTYRHDSFLARLTMPFPRATAALDF